MPQGTKLSEELSVLKKLLSETNKCYKSKE